LLQLEASVLTSVSAASKLPRRPPLLHGAELATGALGEPGEKGRGGKIASLMGGGGAGTAAQRKGGGGGGGLQSGGGACAVRSARAVVDESGGSESGGGGGVVGEEGKGGIECSEAA